MAKKSSKPFHYKTPKVPKGEEPVCIIRQLAEDELILAAESAIVENPANAPLYEMAKSVSGLQPTKSELAFLTGKYWGPSGKTITVGFLDSPNAATRRMILQYANEWSNYGNVRFVETATDPMVRIARVPNDGYWSYLGTDILRIPRNQQTMNLAGFTENTRESEYLRVVVHEFGHTLGAPHEHLRKEFVDNIDPNKAIAYFRQYAGWNEQVTRSNVLTPLEQQSILGSTPADPTSVMAYSLPGTIMKNGVGIVGGSQLSPQDKAFVATIYPKVPAPPPPPIGSGSLVQIAVDSEKKEIVVTKPDGWTVR